MRKTIYFRDDGSWEAIKGAADKEGLSVSKYIVRRCLSSGVVSKTVVKDSGQLDRIEKKVDALVGRVFDLPEGVEVNISRAAKIDLLEHTSPPKKSDPAGAKQDVIDSLKAKVAKIPGKKSDPYFRPMEKKGSKKGGKK